MRKLIVTEFITLDGVIEAPGGEPTHPHAGWTMPFGSSGMFEFKLAEALEAGSLLLGRKTYEGFAAAWPERDGVFADAMNAMPKHVVTSGRSALTWNATALTGDVPGAVAGLKAADGGPILVAGSGTLVKTLLANDLVDELRLLTFPVIVGGGLGIWSDARGRQALRLAEQVRYDNDVVLSTYLPSR